MKREGVKFRISRPKFGIIFVALYFVVVAGAIAYYLAPRSVEASTEDRLFIPNIGLISRVENIKQNGATLEAPDRIAGAFFAAPHKIVLIGHSSTVFKNLHDIPEDSIITFDDKEYRLISTEIVEKSSVDMSKIVAETERNTIILMTCYGESLGGQDYSHRFIVTAEEI